MHELVSRQLFDEEVREFTPRLANKRGWIFHNLEYPTIDCEFCSEGKIGLRLLLTCDNWNEQPPSIKLLTPDGQPLAAISNPTNVFNLSAHPITGNFFVCMRGSREYHTHYSHLTDSWESIKVQSKYSLGGILTQLWRAWQKGIN